VRRIGILFLLALFAVTALALAQEDDETTDISPALLSELTEFNQDTEALRQLETLETVTVDFPSRQEVIDFFTETVNEELDEAGVLEATTFYRAFDFVETDFDVVGIYAALLGDQVAGYYDTETDEMNVVAITNETLGDRLPALEAITYVHEYVHALQDQHYDLFTLLDSLPDDNADRILAVQSLVEGDATYVMNEFALVYLQENPDAAMEILSSEILEQAALPEDIPPILEAELLAPYDYGLTFVTALIAEGGWEAVDAAFENPPVSMEQILHPAKYFAGEMPVAVSLTEADLGDTWEFVADGQMGQFYLNAYLRNEVSNRQANTAAAGWGGDRYGLYYNAEDDAVAFVVMLALDTPEDTDEFIETYTTYAGDSTEAEADGDCWNGDTGTLCLRQLDDTTVIFAGGPGATTAQALLDAQ
jgi:hypothetical protein